MWPWEHLAFGYLLFSLAWRVGAGDTPRVGAAVAVVLFSQVPDLVDKPLAWWLAVLPAGRSLGHSVLLALPVCLLVLAVARRRGRTDVGVAVAVGWASHLVGDVAYPLATDGELRTGFLLWPVTRVPAGGTTAPLPHLRELAAAFLGFLGTPAGAAYLLFEAALMGTALIVYAADGAPGVGVVRRFLAGGRPAADP